MGEELLLNAIRQFERLGELGPTFLGEPGRFGLHFQAGADRTYAADSHPVRAGSAGLEGGMPKK